ncbi:MAG TPA: ricin-type beta-trefoil lectin domain protein [Patescibacteria group bacterium]|nr:ricin-type beta-trefoil lectin domain protein [Patescibacteria group bacterium]
MKNDSNFNLQEKDKTFKEGSSAENNKSNSKTSNPLLSFVHRNSLLVIFVVAFAVIGGIIALVATRAATPGEQLVSGVGNKCLDVSGDQRRNGVKVQLWSCNGSPAQKWEARADGTMHVNGEDNWCLDVSNQSTQYETIVQLWYCNGTPAQKWNVNNVTHTIVYQKAPTMCLDVKHSDPTNGNQIWIFGCNQTVAQKWTLLGGGTTPAPTPTPTPPTPNPTPNPAATPTPTPTPTTPVPAGVVWSDEFNGSSLSLSDTTAHRSWLPSEGGVYDTGHRGGGSDSWEWTPYGTSNVNLWTVANGVLTMKAIRNNGYTYGNDRKPIPANWLGGTITSDPASGRKWTYGYFEFRARLPIHGSGMFPALWLYRSVDVTHHSDAEFDLMEIFGQNSQPWYTTVHYGGNRDSTDGDRGYNSDTTGWHTYGVDWQPDHIAFYRDGAEYARRTGGEAQWFNGASMGIRMDYAVDPNFNGNKSNNSTPNPLAMEIDYVRVYRNKP